MKKLLLFILLAVSYFYSAGQNEKYLSDLRNKVNTGSDSLRVFTYINIGTYFNQRDNFDSAKYYFEKALALAKKTNLPAGMCAAYNSIGEIQYKYELYEEALESYLTALKIAEKNNLYKYMGIAYALAANFFNEEEKGELALEYYAKAMENQVKAGDSISLTATYVRLGAIYFYKNDFGTSKKYIDTALRICDGLLAKETNPQRVNTINALKSYRRAALQNKGWIAEEEKRYDEALAIYTQLSKDVESMEGIQQRVTYMIDIATVYEKMKEYNKSIEYTQQALQLLKEDSIPYLYDHIYQVQADAYAGMGKYKEAYDVYRKYKVISDSLLNEKNLTISTEMQTKYETEKKEQQITTLNTEKKGQRVIMGISIGAFIVALGLLLFALRANRLQKRLFAREKELQKKEMEKRMYDLEQTALRAQMNPHFIFNSLNSVQRFVINNDVEGVNQYLSTFANLIRQTLENSGKSLIPLKDELRYLDTYLRLEQMRGNDKFRYLINVNEDIDTEETYIPNMIIQPYLENSIIHGMAGKMANEGLINLTISKNHKLTCIVDDNGAGIAATKTYRKTVTTGHESMGTTITEKRIEMFNTVNSEKIELEVMDKSVLHNNESGTRIMIKFPLNPTAN
jgi:tetratricopeptide (TPR) repeat protein